MVQEKKGTCRCSDGNVVDVKEVQQVDHTGPVNHGLIIIDTIPCVKLIINIHSRLWISYLVYWLNRIPQMSQHYPLLYVSRDNCHLSRLHHAWIGYCAVWLCKLTRRVNMSCFQLVWQIWEGCGWERMHNLFCKGSSLICQKAWFKIGMNLWMRYIVIIFVTNVCILGVIGC